jgi:hypothetical protein
MVCTTTGRNGGDRFIVSAVTVTKSTPLGRRRKVDTRYLAGEGRERRRNRMKTSFIAMMLIVAASLFYVMVV